MFESRPANSNFDLRGEAFGRRRYGRPLVVLAMLIAFVVTAIVPAAASADTGFEGRSFNGTVIPTGTKRGESVLWFNDGSWWANMWDTGSQDFHIFRLDTATQNWIDTGVAIDKRPNTLADVLFAENGKLYVASHRFVADGAPATAGPPAHLFRFSYNQATKKYTLDSGFPVVINNYRTESLVFDRASNGKLWATWQQDDPATLKPDDALIFVNSTNGNDRMWGTPFQLPVPDTSVNIDDSSALIAFKNRIVVLWSKTQDPDPMAPISDGFFFALHNNSDPDGTWTISGEVPDLGEKADDHINLKSLQGTSGKVYAAIKTNETSSSAALIRLLVFNGSSWSDHTVGRVSNCHNRPSVLVDTERKLIHVIMTGPHPTIGGCNATGGAIYMKTSPLSPISFPSGVGTPIIVDSDSAAIHNASSTKQNLNKTTDIAVLAINAQTRRYWHHHPRNRIVQVTSTVTIKRSGSAFRGKVKASRAICKPSRAVKLLRAKRGRDPLLGTDLADLFGRWTVDLGGLPARRAVLYAKLKPSTTSTANTTFVCRGARSRSIAVG